MFSLSLFQDWYPWKVRASLSQRIKITCIFRYQLGLECNCKAKWAPRLISGDFIQQSKKHNVQIFSLDIYASELSLINSREKTEIRLMFPKDLVSGI